MLVQDDIAGRDVAVQQPGLVHRVQRLHNGIENCQHQGQVKAAALLDQILHRLAFDILHNDIRCAVFIEEVVHLHNCRDAAQTGERFRFLIEAPDAFLKVVPCAG